MNLLLHIGTHKTATTSIQHFCSLNADVLCREGFYYPKSQMSAYEHNMLADKLSRGDMKMVQDFLKTAKSDAQKKKCHTVVISAESFYAMTAFFLTPRIAKGAGNLLPFNRQDDYWQREAAIVEGFKKCTDGFSEIRLACYVRPQDEFAFSIYNQFVKNVFGVNASFELICERMKEAFDYKRHLTIWADKFGDGNLKVYAFHEWKKNILKHFCEQHLNLECLNSAKNDDFMANTRLTRDVLEARRVYLQKDYNISEALVVARAFIGLCDKYPDKTEGDQVFGSDDFRQTFFASYQDGNDELVHHYGLNGLRAFQGREDSYAGCDAARMDEIISDVMREVSRPSRMAVVTLKKIYRYIVVRLPFIKGIMVPVKSYLYSFKLKKLGW